MERSAGMSDSYQSEVLPHEERSALGLGRRELEQVGEVELPGLLPLLSLLPHHVPVVQGHDL